MNQIDRRLFLIRSLLNERPEYRDWRIPQDVSDQKLLLRGLMNVRPAQTCDPEFLRVQDAYLRQATAEKGITDCTALSPVQPGLYLWQGDITTLKSDTIVNAANSGMTGCYAPNHRCIDNAIHTFAGVQLRLACAEIMERQGCPGRPDKPKSPRRSTCLAAIFCTPSARSSTRAQQNVTARSLKAATAPA